MRISFDLYLEGKIRHGAKRSDSNIKIDDVGVLINLRGVVVLKNEGILDVDCVRRLPFGLFFLVLFKLLFLHTLYM